MAEPRVDRFTKGKICPICGGSNNDPRGQGSRCSGFRSGNWIHCSREEHAGKAAFSERSQTYAHTAKGLCPCGTEHAPADFLPDARNARMHVYKYRNLEGQVIFETVRFKNPKDFRQRRPIGNGKFAWNLEGVTVCLYNLPALVASDPAELVWICEGEKDVDRLGSLGLMATTNPMGAEKWRDEYSDALKGRSIVILLDNDEPGHRHGQQVARSLQGRAASVKVVELPGVPDHGDVSDFLDAGGTVDRLRELARETSEWKPPAGEIGPQPSGNGRLVRMLDGTTNYAILTPAELNIKSTSDVKIKPITWLWPYRLAAGEMALIAGEGGLGKSQLMLWIAAAISRGWPWPDQSGDAPLGDVLIVTAEDAAETTIVPRLTAMGADLGRIRFTEAPKIMIQEHGKELFINFEWLTSIRYWKRAFDLFPNTKLMIMDPIVSFLGKGVSDQKNDEVRGVIEPFIEQIIRERGICFLANTHLNKSLEAKSVKHRISASIAFVNIPRNVHVVLRDDIDPEARIFGQCKCNNAPDNLASLKFHIQKRELTADDGMKVETSIPVFSDELVSVDLNRVMAGDKGKGKGPRPVQSSKFAEWLFNQLKDHPVLVRDLVDDARDAGLMVVPSESDPKPSMSPLYNAKRRLPDLNKGWIVEEILIDNRKAWHLVWDSAESQANQPSESDHATTPF